MTEKELKNGAVFTFVNDAEMLEAEVSYGKSASGREMFKIFFNGTFVHLSLTFASAERKLRQLKQKYDLKFSSINS